MNNRIILMLLLATALLTGCKNDEKSAVAPVAPNISVTEAIEDSVTLYASYPGYLQAVSRVDLVARVSGYQQASLYKSGEWVNEGDTLFIIEPTQYEDAVAQAEAALATAKSEYYYAENNYNRMKDVANSNAISEIDLIKSEAAYYQAEAAIKNAEAALQSARTNLDYCYVKAPFAGRMSATVYSTGAYLTPGINDKLATIYQDDEMYAYFSIDDAQYMKLLQNLKNNNTKLEQNNIRFSFSEPLPHEYKGHINYIAPNIDLTTGTLTIRVKVKNPYGELRHGMYTIIHLPYSRSEKVVMVRDASIGTDQLGKYIYVVNDSNRVEMRHIEIGELYQDSLRIVTSGVSAGERYVTKAMQKVREGMTINPVE